MDKFAGQLITLQFGSFSNFIGTHYWNIQEETVSLGQKLFAPAVQVMDHDVLFRQGQTLKEESTYTPRLLIFDLKGGYGSLRKGGYQYEEYVASSKHFVNKQHVHQKQHAEGSAEHHSQNLNVLEEEMKMKYARAWGGEVEVIAEEPKAKTRFLKLLYGEETVEHPSTTTTSQQKKEKSGMEDIDEDMLEPSASSAPQSEKPLSQQVTEDLEENVKYWSDYLKPFLHPKSICEIADFKYDIDPFDVFPIGHQLFQDQKIDKEDNEYFNQLRFFMEECDHLKGFQLFFDQHNAWGAVASDFVDMMRDDIGTKIPIITVGSTPYFDSIEPRSNTALNLALSMASMLPNSNLYIPLSSKRLKNHFSAINQEEMGLVNFNAEKPFHASALFAMAIDTATSSLRLNSQHSKGFYSLGDLINTLTVYPSLKVATLCGAAPLPLLKGQSFYDMLYKSPINQFPYLVSMSPGYDRMKNPTNPFGHATTIRGISEKNMTLYPRPEAPPQLSVQEQISLLMSGRQLPQQKPFRHEDLENRDLANCTEFDEMLYNYIHQTTAQQVRASIIEQSTVVPEAYPDILSPSLLSNGYILPKNQIPEKQTILSMPTMSHLQTTSGIITYMKQCANSIDKNTKFNVPYPYNIVSKDDYGEMKETLLSTIDAYEE